MNSIIKKISNIHLYFLPISAFFILISTAATNLFILLVLIVGLFQIVKEKKYGLLLEKSFLRYSILLYIILIISALYSEADIGDIYHNIEKYLKFILLPIIYVYIKINKNEYLVLKYFLSGTTVILFFSYLKYFNLINFDFFYEFCNLFSANNISEKVVMEKSSIFMHYINHGIIMTVYFFVTLMLGVRRKKGIFIILSILSFINILFLTDSRTAYIILLSILILFLFHNYNKTLLSTYFVGILLFTVFLASNTFENNFSKRISLAFANIENVISNNDFSSSTGARYLWLKIGLNSSYDNLVFGSGLGSFAHISARYLNNQEIINNHEMFVTSNPHNEYISILVQAGLCGLVFFLLFVFSQFRRGNKFIFSNGIFITVLLSCAFNSAFYDNMLGIFLVIVIALSNQDNINKSIGI